MFAPETSRVSTAHFIRGAKAGKIELDNLVRSAAEAAVDARPLAI
jgi:hypothetical protein